jgi:ribosome biogenesis GTPase
MSDHPKEKRPKRWVACPIEEEYFGDDRKLGKIERKRASAKDRSKYKKTDREKHAKPAEYQGSKENLLRGRVLSITPQGILVEHENKQYVCSLRGALKKDKSQFKNLVTVGDFVLFEVTPDQEGLIAHVEPRKSILSRADNLSRRKEQLIAANIDQVIITTSVVSPPIKPFLVDRYIIAAQKGGMQPVIVINKMDLLNDENADPIAKEVDREILEIFLPGYQQAGVPVISVSVETGEGLDELRNMMKDKASVFSGQSGVGKSSLINAIAGESLRTGKIVSRTQKGAHTTTTAQLIPLEFGGWCIDTPGIKSFGVWDLKREEIEQYFPEIHDCGLGCKFPDCRHLNEAECAVMEAVEKGEISALRFESYQILIESLSQEHLRR